MPRSKKENSQLTSNVKKSVRIKPEPQDDFLPPLSPRNAPLPQRSSRTKKGTRRFWTARTTSLSCPIFLYTEELSNIWEQDPRMPSAISRRNWALARNVDPVAVHRWFNKRREKLRKKGIHVSEEQYELPLGSPIMRRGFKKGPKAEPTEMRLPPAPEATPVPAINDHAHVKPPLISISALSAGILSDPHPVSRITFIEDSEFKTIPTNLTFAPNSLVCTSSLDKAGGEVDILGHDCALCSVILPVDFIPQPSDERFIHSLFSTLIPEPITQVEDVPKYGPIYVPLPTTPESRESLKLSALPYIYRSPDMMDGDTGPPSGLWFDGEEYSYDGFLLNRRAL